MKKRLLYMLLAATTIGAIAAKTARADDGDACTTADGRSGYIFAGGRDGGDVCRAE